MTDEEEECYICRLQYKYGTTTWKEESGKIICESCYQIAQATGADIHNPWESNWFSFYYLVQKAKNDSVASMSDVFVDVAEMLLSEYLDSDFDVDVSSRHPHCFEACNLIYAVSIIDPHTCLNQGHCKVSTNMSTKGEVRAEIYPEFLEFACHLADGDWEVENESGRQAQILCPGDLERMEEIRKLRKQIRDLNERASNLRAEIDGNKEEAMMGLFQQLQKDAGN